MRLSPSAYLPHTYRLCVSQSGMHWRYIVLSALSGLGEHRSPAIYRTRDQAKRAGRAKIRELSKR